MASTLIPEITAEGQFINPTVHARYSPGSLNPGTYGAAGDGAVIDSAALSAMITAAPVNGIIDLGGRTYRVDATLNVHKTVVIRNGTLLSSDVRTAILTSPDTWLLNVTVIRTGTGGTASSGALVTNAPRMRLVDVTAKSSIGEALRMGNGNSDGNQVRGGYYESSDPDDSSVIHLVSGGTHAYDVKVRNATVRHLGYGSAITLYNCSRSSVEHCDVRGIRASPWYVFPSNSWTLVSGTIYRAPERPDTFSNAVWVDGVEVRKEYNTSTPPLNKYATPGDGYFYLNVGADPSPKLVRTRRTNGYGILFYTTSTDTVSVSDNLVAHNHVEDVDGFGIYYQTLQNTPRNNRTRSNTLINVCKMGIGVNDLPFAAIGVFGGTDVSMEGDFIDGAGTAEYPCPGIDFKASVGVPHMSGKIKGVTVKRAAAKGVQLAPGTWEIESTTSSNNGTFGFGHGTITAADTLRAKFIHCVAENNGSTGLHFEVVSGAAGAIVQPQISGGSYTKNLRNIVIVRCQDIFIGAGVYAGETTSNYNVTIGAACSAITIDDLHLGSGSGLSTNADAVDLFIGLVNYKNSTGLKLNVGGPYRTGGVKGFGSEQWAGAGTPEAVVTAPVGAMYRRTDGGAGTTLYLKESGTGNTGWVAK